MRIAEWMTKQLYVARPLDSIRHAREIMEKQRVNQLPVVVNSKLVGIVTDRDLRDAYPSVFEQPAIGSRSRAKKPSANDPDHTHVEAVMTPHVLTLSPDDDLLAAAELMRRERIGAVPVVANDTLVGLVTRTNILDAFVRLAATERADATLASAR